MKKIIIGIVVLLLSVGGGYFGYIKVLKKEEATSEENHWNPYARHEKILYTLPDYLLSVSSGERVMKMTVTLEFGKEEGLYKFKGYESVAEAVEASKAKSGGHGAAPADPGISPMEIEINSILSQFMLNLPEEELSNIDTIETKLKDEINLKLELDEKEKVDFIKHVYIENVVIN